MVYIAKTSDGRAIVYYQEQCAISDGLEYVLFESIPEGNGILKTDLKSLWWEPMSEQPEPPKPPVPQVDPITKIQLAVAELAEAAAQNNLNNKLAIAELAEILAGGKTNG